MCDPADVSGGRVAAEAEVRPCREWPDTALMRGLAEGLAVAEYFDRVEEAEEYLRRATQPVALYARIHLRDAEKWIVDHQHRDRGTSIVVLDDLTSHVGEAIARARNRTLRPERPRMAACPGCGSTQSPFGRTVALKVFRCRCGQECCDQCSGGGLIELPRCPSSPYHEGVEPIGSVAPPEPAPAASDAVACAVTDRSTGQPILSGAEPLQVDRSSPAPSQPSRPYQEVRDAAGPSPSRAAPLPQGWLPGDQASTGVFAAHCARCGVTLSSVAVLRAGLPPAEPVPYIQRLLQAVGLPLEGFSEVGVSIMCVPAVDFDGTRSLLIERAPVDPWLRSGSGDFDDADGCRCALLIDLAAPREITGLPHRIELTSSAIGIVVHLEPAWVAKLPPKRWWEFWK
jgi:hypothetical protein